MASGNTQPISPLVVNEHNSSQREVGGAARPPTQTYTPERATGLDSDRDVQTGGGPYQLRSSTTAARATRAKRVRPKASAPAKDVHVDAENTPVKLSDERAGMRPRLDGKYIYICVRVRCGRQSVLPSVGAEQSILQRGDIGE